MINFKTLCLSLLALFIFSSCEDPSSIGSGLLEGEQLNLSSTSEFDIELSTEAGRPLVALVNNSSNLSSYVIGSYTDPVFGEVSGKIFSRLAYNSSANAPIFSNAIIDSVVLVMSYDSAATYPTQFATHDISVHEVVSTFKSTDTIYTNTEIGSLGQVVGSLNLVPKPKDTLTIKDYLIDTINQKLVPQIRVPLDKSWFFNKFKSLTSSDTLSNILKGLQISSNSKNGLLGLNFNAVNDASSGINGVYVYYRENQTTKRIYKFLFNPFKYHNIKSTPSVNIKNALGKPEIGNTQAYIQGFDGVVTKIKVKDISKLKGKVINHALLSFKPLALPGDNIYNPINQLGLVYYIGGTLNLVRDLDDVINVQLPISFGFGGNIETGRAGNYEFNMTKTVKDMIAGKIPNNELVIYSFFAVQRPQRSVIAGPKHPTSPMKLKVIYTDAN